MERAHLPLRTFGRTRSRTLRSRPAALLAELLPGLATPTAPFDPRTIAPGASEVWLEIGFGGGEHLCAQAARRPDVLLLGAEPFVNGVASALGHIDRSALANVRIHAGDGRELMAALPDASIDRLFLLFPDPWPKLRHHKRRLIGVEFIAQAARVMRSAAVLRFVTDWADYAGWTLERLAAAADFRWTAGRADDWRVAPADHFPTRYERKQLGDCAPIWLEFERV
ncbi:MAG TPA: tRNA (guanosine(46)-N7)-methyltransferase TrmB [Caulobacteraceae bacterium]|nr:tRNA (guanosine(46)-N7)-methyltransferase TrmB [Caulobacteraceae bacterium]